MGHLSFTNLIQDGRPVLLSLKSTNFYRLCSGWWCICCRASVCLSVCPFVCLSVTHITQEWINISTPNHTWDICRTISQPLLILKKIWFKMAEHGCHLEKHISHISSRALAAPIWLNFCVWVA